MVDLTTENAESTEGMRDARVVAAASSPPVVVDERPSPGTATLH
jgi:hypothetical protein